MPSTMPTPSPTKLPTTSEPTMSPSLMPSPSPTALPTTPVPSSSPSLMPSPSPTFLPTTPVPSSSPSLMPSPSPSQIPSTLPTASPSDLPTTPTPSTSPSLMPSPSPTKLPTTTTPSQSPSLMPSPSPTLLPSIVPTQSPTDSPITSPPTARPSLMPSPSPTLMPSTIPTPSPTKVPTTPTPSGSPSLMPSPSPSPMPTLSPTLSPTDSSAPTHFPTRRPSPSPTDLPSPSPTWSPTHTIECITITSEFGEVNGTYIKLPEVVGGKTSWANGQVELFFSDDGIFEGSWVIHNKVNDNYLIHVKDDPYQGDSFPPLDTETVWQLFVDGGVAPGNVFYKVIINAAITCRPTVVPTRAPTKAPTEGPTEKYLCVILTWNTTDPAYSDVPTDFYGAYYYNDLMSLSDNEFSKFPIYPSVVNGKPVFTKKRNDNSLSFFFVPNAEANHNTWVFDSEDHNNFLTATIPAQDADLPRFSAYPDGKVVAPYEWSLFMEGTYSTGLVFDVQMSTLQDTCEMYDTDGPTPTPTGYPTSSPSPSPSLMPTPMPTSMPSAIPTPAPTDIPSVMPSSSPTFGPTSQPPTSSPTPLPTQYPTLEYDCINITSLDSAYSQYNGIYTKNDDTRNNREYFTDGNTGFDLYYVPAAIMIDHAWVLEGSSNDKMSIYDVDLGTWTEYGQSDEVPPYGTFTWKEFSSPPNPASFDEIQLNLVPLINCVTTQSPTQTPTEFPTISTPAPTTPSPTTVPTSSPSSPPSAPPTGTPTPNPTKVCRVLVVNTPLESGNTSIFEGNYVVQSTFRNGKLQWYNSHNGYWIFFVNDDWLPSSWVFQGDDGMDEIAVFDDGTDGHPDLAHQSPKPYILFYWGHNLQKRTDPMLVNITCIDTMPPTNIPTPGPSPLPSLPPTTMPSPAPSLNPSPAPTSKPSTQPTPSPSTMPSTLPSSSPTLSPTLPTPLPTSSPTTSPSRSPTHVCPCFVVESNFTSLNGMYQLEDEQFKDHDRWVNYDNRADIQWADDAAFDEYWVITANDIYAIYEDTGRWGYTPPVGLQIWTIFESSFITGGVDSTVTLDCTTCAPTPLPTSLPTPVSTPSPTTPSPTVVPTPSPSQMPSTMPTASPTLGPTTLNPTPLSDEPTLMPSPSPTNAPSTPVPSSSPSLMPSPSPSSMPSALPTPSPTKSPVLPTLMPSPSPTKLPTTTFPSQSPSLMPSPSPTAMPSIFPTPSPTALPTTLLPSSSPSAMPSPSPSQIPSALPSPSPTSFPTLMPSPSPTADPTVTCPCLIVQDPENTLADYVGLYRYQNNSSPNSNHWMWERLGDNTQELIYFSQFGTSAARWVIKGSTYGEWAETSAHTSDATPPVSGVWFINNKNGNFYYTLTVTCSQCEVTPSPTPDPTESPTSYPTSLAPTRSPTPIPSQYCHVLNVTDLTNGFYTGFFEMDVLPYNDYPKWTDLGTGETLKWADTAMFEHEPAVQNIWMLGFESVEGEQDSHFLIYRDTGASPYPPLRLEEWNEYTFNADTNRTSEVLIDCHDTIRPTLSPTGSPTEPFCPELFVKTCCDGVYVELDS